MSDFDVVLERLVADPAFAAALAADPVRALAGYRLGPDEVALLHTQVGGDAGGQHQVEVRANQSSLFGMLSPLGGLAGALPGVAEVAGGVGSGQASPAGRIGTPMADPVGGSTAGQGGGLAGVGWAAGRGLGANAAAEGFGSARPAGVQGFGSAGQGGEIGGSVRSGTAAVADAAQAGFGRATGGGVESGAPAGPGAEPVVPEGYRTKVDVDGDGNWDRHLVRGRADGGVDILVDRNRDGRVDFVGHDLDADGLVEVSEYDRNHDGFFEKRMYDDDGDGWMDRSERVSRPGG